MGLFNISSAIDLAEFTAAHEGMQLGASHALQAAVTKVAATVRDVAQDHAPSLHTAGGNAVPGLLRSSIIAEPLRRNGDGWMTYAGPVGEHVHLYSGKQERRYGFMAAGAAAGQAVASGHLESEIGSAFAGYA